MMSFSAYCKKVGLNVDQMFTPLISDNYGRTRVFNGRKLGGKRYEIGQVVVHTTANNASAKNEARNIYNNPGINSFHAVVDKHGVIETVRFNNTAHHAGNRDVNLRSLGFELTDDDPAAGYENFVKYIGYVMAQLNLGVNAKTVRFHNEIVNTSCGKFLRDKGKAQVVADIAKYAAIAEEKPAPKPVEPAKPTPKPQPESSGKFKKGDIVTVNGLVHINSGGAKPGITLKNHRGTITSIAPLNTKCPYHIDKLGWVTADAIGVVKPAPKPKPEASNKQYINIHRGKDYGVYPLGVAPVARNIKWYLDPNIVRDGKTGLSYEIKGKTSYPNVYYIQTRDFGRVQIFHERGRASITTKPLYKVMG